MGTADDENNANCSYADQQECGFSERSPNEFLRGPEDIPRYLPEHQKLENIIQDGRRLEWPGRSDPLEGLNRGKERSSDRFCQALCGAVP
jgi:hypothetical protein